MKIRRNPLLRFLSIILNSFTNKLEFIGVIIWLKYYIIFAKDVNKSHKHKPASLNRQKGLDVGRSTEDTLQVNPATLHINPDIKQSVDPVELVLPGDSLLFKYLPTSLQFFRQSKIIKI